VANGITAKASLFEQRALIISKDAQAVAMHDKLVIGETAPTDFDNPTVIDMNHTEPGDGRENLGVTTSTFDTLYAGYTGETAITFDTGYIAKIGTLPSSIDVEDACVP